MRFEKFWGNTSVSEALALMIESRHLHELFSWAARKE